MLRRYTGTGGQLIFNSSGQRIPTVGLDGQMIGYGNTNLFFNVNDWGRQGSDIAVDPTNDTLWSVDDTPGRQLVANTDKGMSVKGVWNGQVIDSSIRQLEGVTVNPHDGTLYFVDDTQHLPDGVKSRVWHCDRNCAPLGPGFNLTAHGVTSGQAIEYDIQDDTLLIVCNDTKAVYRIDAQTFDLVSVTDLSRIPNQPKSWQGIAIDTRDGFWWLSAYDPNTIIHVDPANPNSIRQYVNVANGSFAGVNIGHVAGIAFDPEGVGIPYEDIAPPTPDPDPVIVAVETAAEAVEMAETRALDRMTLDDALASVAISHDQHRTAFIAAFVAAAPDHSAI